MRSIVMTAGCSGCGTAAVTAAVARQLALQGKKVLLVEATAGLRRMNRLLEIREEGLFDFSDLLEGRCALENALLPTRIAGLTLLQGPSAIDWVPEAADVQLLREELSGTEQYDALLWYCPPGASRSVRSRIARDFRKHPRQLDSHGLSARSKLCARQKSITSPLRTPARCSG